MDAMPPIARLVVWIGVAYICGAIFDFDGFYFLTVAMLLATSSIIMEEHGNDDPSNRGDHFP